MNDKLKIWKSRPYSWSQHSSFDWDKEQWFQSYVLGIRGEGSAAMIFGNTVGDSLGTPNAMVEMPTLPHKEFEVHAKLGDIDLIGFFDFYCDDKTEIQENKTSSNEKKWTQESVHEHGQLDFYCTLLYLPHTATCKDDENWNCKAGCERGKFKPHRKIKPEDVRIKLYYIPVNETQDFGMEVTKGAKVKMFPTVRSTKQIFQFMIEIKKRRKEMEAYAIRRLSELA